MLDPPLGKHDPSLIVSEIKENSELNLASATASGFLTIVRKVTF